MHAGPRHLTLSFSSSISIAGSKKSSWMNVIYFRRSPSRLFMLPAIYSGGGIMFSIGPFVRPSVHSSVTNLENTIFYNGTDWFCCKFAQRGPRVEDTKQSTSRVRRSSAGSLEAAVLSGARSGRDISLDPLSPYTGNRYGGHDAPKPV